MGQSDGVGMIGADSFRVGLRTRESFVEFRGDLSPSARSFDAPGRMVGVGLSLAEELKMTHLCAICGL